MNRIPFAHSSPTCGIFHSSRSDHYNRRRGRPSVRESLDKPRRVRLHGACMSRVNYCCRRYLNRTLAIVQLSILGERNQGLGVALILGGLNTKTRACQSKRYHRPCSMHQQLTTGHLTHPCSGDVGPPRSLPTALVAMKLSERCICGIRAVAFLYPKW
jgi:hypothetical protein